MKRRSFLTDNRAVSESLGYIMIFGIITACIALVFITGSRIIADTQDRASYQGMEQSFEVISSDITRTALESSPAISTRVKIDSGTLGMFPSENSGTVFNIDYNKTSYSYPLGILVYQSNTYGQSICLENGALVKMYGNDSRFGTIMTLHPRIYFSAPTKTLYIAVINLDGDYQGVAGGYISNIKSSFIDSSFKSINSTNTTAYLSIRTNYTGAWNDYWNDYFKSNYGSALFTIESFDAGWTDADKWTTVKLMGVEEIVVVTYNVEIKM